ncbi:MAG: hypothetical protein Q9197_004859, partial [Variospora fuerteventurae]
MHAGNEADPPPSRASAEHVAPRNRTGTSFPSLTGRKSSLTDQEPIATATFESKVSFSALQHTARQHHVLPRAIPMLAWARLLELYTASEEHIVFHCLLPWGRDTPANDACRSSLVSCTFNVQERGQVAIGPLSSRFNRHVTPDQCVQHKTLSPDEPLGNHQRQGTLLNLENLQHSSANCNLLKDGSHLLAVYAATLRIQSPPIISGPLSLAISGRADLINKGAAQLLLAQYDHIMEVIVQCPDESFGCVNLHAPDSLLSISNPQPVVSIEYSSLQSQFENVARSDPQQVALEFWTRKSEGSLQPDTVWTYGELDSRAEKIAAELEDRFGSLIDHIVPLCMDRCPEIYAAILGILKAGAAWCPIDPSFPPLRRHELITRTAAKVLVVNAQSPRDGVPGNVVAVDLTRLEGSSSEPLNRIPTQPDSLAYLIWTSGTTGAPKGVPISHHAATASMRALQVSISTNVKSGRVRCLQFSQFTFDVFVQDLFYTWGVGGTLIAADRTSMLGSFAELATGSQATHAHLTPAFAASVPREHCPTLEVVTMIGEKLTQNVAHDWSQDCRLYNTYGPAEATVVATFRRVPHEDDVPSANVGLPLPSVSAFVIHNGQLMLKGGTGELALGGPQLSKGYWKDSAKTKQCFLWNERLQCILYMTGDVVRQLQDGTFEFVGRNDDLIKIQGIRVELSEVAFALRSCHPEVRQVEVAFLERHDRPSKVIVAFLAAPTSNRCDTGIVDDEYGVEVARAALETAKIQLPTYMIPKVFLVIHAIPRTSSAKVDRNFIQRLYAHVDLGAWERKLGSAGNGNNSVADLDPREVMIVEIISGLTGTSKESMSRHSTLQSLGVDSITATRLVTRLSGQDAAVSIVDILQCSTLEELFHCARREYADTNRRFFDLSAFHQDVIGSLTPDLVNRVEIVMPTLPFQESLLSESFQNPVSYWSHNLFQLGTDINLKKLEKAWHDIARCTEALRASFCAVADVAGKLRIESTFLQLINKDVCVDWVIISATDNGFELAARQRAREIAELRQEERFVQPLWAVTAICLESRNLMMLSIHHAIRDDRSVQTIMADLQQAYLDNDTQQMQQRHQIRDAVSLLYTADTDCFERDEKFWSESLSPFNDGIESRSWPELKLVDDGQNEGTVTCCWDAAESYNNLRIKAAGIGAASLAAVLRVVWGCILLEYLEADKVVFGETWSARSDVPGLSDTVAPLVSVLPVPFQVQSSWREMLQLTSNFQQQSKNHRGVHPRSIRKILRRVDDEALYPAVFNFVPDSAQPRHNDHGALWQEADDVLGLSVEHAIAFNAVVSDHDVLQFDLTARKRFADREHLQVLSSQIDALLDSILYDPEGHLNQIPKQMPQALVSVAPSRITSATNVALEQPPTEWIDRYAALHPDWIAAEVVESLDEENVTSQKWSYEQLQKAYRNVAALISESGCRQRMIAVCLDRRLEGFAVILGIMSSGNTYLPIADDLPKERKSFLLQDSNAALLFTTKSLVMNSSPICRTILVEDLNYSKSGLPISGIYPLPSENSYLLYTSGSTGSPKGVLVSRGNLMSFIEAISHFICSYVDMEKLQGEGKWLGMASYAFDVHLLEMFFPWRHGMSAVTAARSMLLDNLELALQKLKVSHASFVPSLVDNAGLDPATLPDLRYMSLGGEKISKKAISTWARSHVVLANAYGPTEATIGCCFRRVEPTSNVRNIGYPLSYTVAHVLRPGRTEYALRGTSGELCVTGDLVANGYYNRPGTKGFVDDFHGQKMYRTGDKVRLMADGSLEFLGREDDQTKIRGQRIELGEVSEAVRAAAKEVLGVAVIEVSSVVAQHQSLNRPQLVTFLAAQDSPRSIANGNLSITGFADGTTVEKIRASCSSTLPSFMVPDHFIRLTSLPLVPTSRKVDTKQLLRTFNESPLDGSRSSITPITSNANILSDVERVVRSEVAEVLGVEEDKLDANSNLFPLGLDSLNVISLTIKIQRRGFNSNVSKILKVPTIRGIASCLGRKIANGKASHAQNGFASLEQRFKGRSKDGFDMSNVAAVRPCLPLQETLIASSLDREEGETLYVNHVVLELSAGLDHQELVRAWKATAEDHDILRTCFPEFEDYFIQLVLKKAPFSCDVLHDDAGDNCFSNLQQRQPEIAFDIVQSLETKPPVRLTLIESPSAHRKAMLLVSLHHALYDKESFSMLLDEVHAHYQGIPSDKNHASVTAVIDHIESQDHSHAKAFWRRYLASYRPSPAACLTINGKSIATSRKLLTSLSDIERLAASMNSTPASIMQALYGVALAETLHTDDVVFGVVLSGRTIPVENAHRILAPCITTIPQRVQLNQASSLKDVILSAQEGFVESIEYQHTALRDIHRWVEAENPLFNSLFTYTRSKGEASWSHLWKEIEGSMSSGFPLAVEIVADHEAACVNVHCEYSPAFGSIKKADRLLERIQDLVRCLVQGQVVTLEMSSPKGDVVSMSNGSSEMTWTEDQILMRNVISQMVGLDEKNISADTSFFALGIDSILAIQFARRLRRQGVQCSSADIMRYSSIGKLSQQIKEHRAPAPHANGSVGHVENSATSLNGSTDEILKRYACTPLQSSMLTQTLGADAPLYVHHHVVRLSKEDNLAKVRRAWKKLVAGTEILRTGFHFSQATNAWVAFVYDKSPMSWNEHTASVSTKRIISQVKEKMAFQEEKDFQRPPWHVDVVGDIFILSMHHSLYDGESISLLFQDLWALSNCFPLPQRPSFSEAAEAIQSNTKEATHYWAHCLRDFKGNPAESPIAAFREIRSTLDINVTDALKDCQNLRVTLQSVAMLAFAKTLAWLSNQKDIVFGHVVRGRSLPNLEADWVIGPLFNTVPVRVRLESTTATNKDAAQAIQHMTGESQAYQHAPLSKVQQAWQQQTGKLDAQLIGSLFVFQRRAPGTETIRWEHVAVDEDAAPTEYATNFECEQTDTGIDICVNSRDVEDLVSLVKNFEHILLDILQRPNNYSSAVLHELVPSGGIVSNHANKSTPHDIMVPGPKANTTELVRELLAKASGIAVESITNDASIFSLGLDSISAIQIASAARKDGLKLSVADVLQGRTLKGICQRLFQKQDQAIFPSNQMNGGATSPPTRQRAQEAVASYTPQDTISKALFLAGLRDDDVEEILPCLPGQYYHLMTWLKSGRTLSEGTFTYFSKDALDPERLLNAWRSLRERHAILRTSFVSMSSMEVQQIVMKPAAIRSDAFQCIDHSPGALREVVKHTTSRRFDLFTPPVEFVLARSRGSAYHHVILKLHHALYDAWTIGNIIGDLSALYEGRRNLPQTPNSSALIQEILHSTPPEPSHLYWQSSLRDCQPTILTSLSSSPETQPHSFFFTKTTIPHLHRLEAQCQASSTSLPIAILVAYARVLARHTGVTNPTFGLYQTGRSSSSIDGLSASCLPCLTMTPMMLRAALAQDVKTSIEAAQADLAERVPFEQSHLRQILESAGWEPKRPLFNTFVNILWGGGSSSDETPSTTTPPLPLLTPWDDDDAGNVEEDDLAPSQRVPGRTAIERLDTGVLADENLFLDVLRCCGGREREREDEL